MPTVVSEAEIQTVISLLNDYKERTGETNSSIARAAGMRRATVSDLLNPERPYPHSMSFENVVKLLQIAGIRMRFEFDGD